MYEKCIFLLIPNNSGSTFSYKSISKCENVAFIRGEGQFIEGFKGTKPVDYNAQFVWGGTDFVHIISDNTKHDWEHNKKVWSEHVINDKVGCTFVEKSPPNIAKREMLQQNFQNCKFIISIRNPYAVFESIKRVRARRPVSDNMIINHIIHTMKVQRENIEELTKQNVDFVFYRYEDLCEHTKEVTHKLKDTFLELHDISFEHVIPVKRRYNSSIHNYNDEQISRLSQTEIQFISNALSYQKELMDYFHYKII